MSELENPKANNSPTNDPDKNLLSDRAMIVALLEAVLALGKKLTGQPMSVPVETRSGGEVRFTAADYRVKWD